MDTLEVCEATSIFLMGLQVQRMATREEAVSVKGELQKQKLRREIKMACITCTCESCSGHGLSNGRGNLQRDIFIDPTFI